MDYDWKERLSANIRKLLGERGWTQADLARNSGVGSDNISRYMRGKFVPSAKHLAKIADAFGVPVSALHGDEAQVDYSVEFRLLRDDPTRALIRLSNIVPTETAVQILTLLSQVPAAAPVNGADEFVGQTSPPAEPKPRPPRHGGETKPARSQRRSSRRPR